MSLREILLSVICGVLCLLALWRPRIGLYGYVWFNLMRPDYFSFVGPEGVYSPVIAAGTLLGSLRYFAEFPVVLRNPVSRTLVLLQIPIALSVYLALVPELCYERWGEYERMILVLLLTPVLIRTVDQMRTLFLVIAFSIGVMGLKFGLGVLLAGGYHITEGYAGLDNNALAIELVIGICFCWYVRRIVESRLLKLGTLAMIFGSMSTVVLTTSRGGALAMVTVFLLLIFRSRRRVRNFAFLMLLMVPSLVVFRQQFFARMETLTDPHAESSAHSRLVMYEATLRAAMDYPLHGVGFGNLNFIRIYPEYVEDQRIRELGIKVHETYLQMLIDTGIFGFLLFVYLLFGTIFRMWRSQKRCRLQHPGMDFYPLAIMTSLIAAAQYGVTGGIERYSFIYIPLMCGAAWYTLEKKLAEAGALQEVETAALVAPVLPEAVSPS
jgi:probable O-glycosylation ligase (exosortase A-associated)